MFFPSFRSRITVFTLSLAVVSGPAVAWAFSKKAPGASPSPPPSAAKEVSAGPGPGEIALSTVMREESLGIIREPEEVQEKMRERARLFLEIRQGRASPERKKTFLEECAARTEPSAFCSLLQEKSRRNASSRNSRLRLSHKRVGQMRNALFRGELGKLGEVTEQELSAALRGLASLSKVEKTAVAVLASGSCANPSVGFFLGAKAEEYLPDEDVRKKAILLYESAAGCGDSEASVRSRYRASLLRIWSGDCAAAVPHLDFLIGGSPNKDYRTRALYWKNQCEGQLGKKEVATGARESLLNEHPLSLHSLLMDKENPGRLKAMAERTDSFVRLRSVNRPAVNTSVAEAETLFLLAERAQAAKVLEVASRELEGSEPEFQLYFSSLLNRVGDYLTKFRVMSAVFRDHPRLISRSSLELYYPLRKLDPEVVQRNGLDELLVLSLIRQESAFNERARSRVGALGLMQLMPRTARSIEKRITLVQLYDPEANIRIGSKYFARLLKKFGGDVELALAAYNAGPDRVEAWLRRYPVQERVLFLDLMPFRETREYVSAIVRNYYWYSLLYSEPRSSVPALAPERVPAAEIVGTPVEHPAALGATFKLLGT